MRWLAMNAALRLMTSADTRENRTDRPSRSAKVLSRLLGQ